MRGAIFQISHLVRACRKSVGRKPYTIAIFALLVWLPAPAMAEQVRLTAGRDIVQIEARQQRQERKVFIADGDVDIRYQETRLRADHIEFNDETRIVSLRGHIQLDYQTQHIEADRGTYNITSGEGSFFKVRGTFRVDRRPDPNLLISPNPLYFEAEEVERLDEKTYRIRHAWVTVCEPDRPKWKFYASRATIQVQKSVELQNSTFRLFTIPVIYLPYATTPAGRKIRQSGFMIPDVGDTSRKGFVFGDSYYWAPTEWMDATLGAQLLSRRGWSQLGDLRMRPWEDARLNFIYYGVNDRGLKNASGVRIPQGGHQFHIGFDAFLPQNWRAVLDLNELSSLTFREAFTETFAEATNSEVRNTAFLTNNFRGFSLNIAALSYKNFLSVTPETSIELRTAPEARLSSVDQAPWRRWPIYLGFDAFADAVNRQESVTGFETPSAVQRMEFAPRLTLPLRWGPWLGATASFVGRTTRYGAGIVNGSFSSASFVRTTEEFTLDLRPPALEHIWDGGDTKWKHTIEPQIVYSLVNGVNEFGRFIRFDEDETLTDTNELQYSLTQRLFRRSGDGTDEILSLRVTQKYFFDPTFGGALVPGQRNVLQALDSLTPFAFADRPRRFSPIVSDLRFMPGRRWDAQVRVDFDPKRGQMTAYGSLLKFRPYRESFITVAHFSVLNLPPTQPASGPPQLWSHQIRALVGYGNMNRRGWNGAFGMSYEVTQKVFQNQVFQVSYNGSCCGIGFEYRRLSLGTIRNENQYRIVLLIANIGSFGNLRREEKIY